MKRVLLTATAAIALATTPAIAQVTGEPDIETETTIHTDVPDVEIDSDTEMDTETADTAEAGIDTDAETDGTWDDAEDEMKSDMDVNAEADVETETEMMPEDGQGGPMADSRADATARLGDLGALADGNVSADVDELDTNGLNDYVLNKIDKADGDVELETETEVEGETSD